MVSVRLSPSWKPDSARPSVTPRTPASSTGVDACWTIATRAVRDAPWTRRPRSEYRSTAAASAIRKSPSDSRRNAFQALIMNRSGRAGCRAAVVELLARARHVVPAVVGRAQRELDHAVRFVVADLAVRLRPLELVEAAAARADDELADAFRSGLAVGILRREPLVVVVVPVDDDVDAAVVERVPDVQHVRRLAQVLPVRARAEHRDVPVGQHARRVMRRQVVLQPLHLLRPAAGVDRAIQRDDVPGPEVVAVIALPLRSGGVAEEVVVRLG